MSKLSILKQKTKRDVDMTQGSIFRHLITFAFPLLIGNIFQQLYNTVDTWVVGNYVSNEAFSAVGTVGPVINMLIGIFLGLSSGAGVVISQYYGAKRYDKVRDTVHNLFAAGREHTGHRAFGACGEGIKNPAQSVPSFYGG